MGIQKIEKTTWNDMVFLKGEGEFGRSALDILVDKINEIIDYLAQLERGINV
jgi:hypothetical protein